MFTYPWAKFLLWAVFFLLVAGSVKTASGQSIAEFSFTDRLLRERHQQDTLFVRPFKKKFSPRFLFGTKQTSFGFGRSLAEIDNKRYYPNVAAFIGVGLFYKTVGISFSYLLEQQNKSLNKKYGKTNFFDLELRSYAVKFGLQAFYQKYSGFYVATPGTILAGKQDTQPQRQDVRLENIGLQLYGIQNWKRFSMQAAFQNTRQQLRSGGSFLYMANLQYINIQGDSAINTRTATTLTEKKRTQVVGFVRGQFFSISPLAGYGHTLVLRQRLYATGVLFVGPGLQYQHLNRPGGGIANYYSPYLATSVKLAFGYNTPKFFTSVQYLRDGNRNYFNGVRLQANTSVLMMQVGYRF